MNLDKLITVAAGVVLAFSLSMNLDKIQTLIWRAQAKLIYESRTETWGSPRFFPRESNRQDVKSKASKANVNQFE